MAILKTVYERTTGKPIYEGFGSDPTEGAPGCGVIETELPPLEEASALPVCGKELVWLIGGQRVFRDDYALSEITLDGLTATLGTGHMFGEIQAEVTEPDSYTFGMPESEVAVALDAVLDEQGRVQLQPYQWTPEADPPQTKGALPAGRTLVKPDLLRGILPAEAESLADLEEEVG